MSKFYINEKNGQPLGYRFYNASGLLLDPSTMDLDFKVFTEGSKSIEFSAKKGVYTNCINKGGALIIYKDPFALPPGLIKLSVTYNYAISDFPSKSPSYSNTVDTDVEITPQGLRVDDNQLGTKYSQVVLSVCEGIETIPASRISSLTAPFDAAKFISDNNLAKNDLEDVDLAKLYDKGIDAKLADDAEVKSNTASIRDLSSKIVPVKPSEVFTGAFTGDVRNIIPTDKSYAEYFISVRALSDTTAERSIILPKFDDIKQGAFFLLDNLDTTKNVRVQAPSGELIDGSATSINVPPENVVIFARGKDGWKKGFSGLIPDSIGRLMGDIRLSLADSLHTFDEIDTELTSRGYDKHGMMAYGVLLNQSVPSSDAWVLGYMNPDETKTIVQPRRGNQRLALAIPTYLESMIDTVQVNNADLNFTDYQYTNNNIDYVLYISDATYVNGTSLKIKITYDAKAASTGIEFDDGSTDKAGVTKVNLDGIEITKDDVSGEVDLRSVIEVDTLDGMNGGRVNRLLVEEPLLTYLNPNAPVNKPQLKFYLKHGYFERKFAPSYVAYLKEEEEIVGKTSDGENHKGAIWFDDIRKDAEGFIQTDRTNKAYGIQEWDGGDPNITDGSYFLIAFVATFRGIAPNDGYVKIGLVDKSLVTNEEKSYLTDANGGLMLREKFYKAGDNLGRLCVSGIVNAKGLKEFRCVIMDTFKDDTLVLADPTEGGTGLLIQAIGSGNRIGSSQLQFESDMNVQFRYSSHYLGVDRMNLKFLTSRDQAEAEGSPGEGMTMSDGWGLHNISKLKMGVSNGSINFSSSGLDVTDFNFHRIFNAEETLMMRGKQERVTVTLVDKDSGWTVALMKWTGAPDEYTKRIFNSRNNGTPNFDTNWSKVDELFISEDVVVGEHTVTKTFTIPSDANNYAFAIYPVVGQNPLAIKLKEFKADVVNPFIGFIEMQTEIEGEKALNFQEKVTKFVQDNQGYASLRYTINTSSSGLPMPCGIPKGSADLSLDTSVNVVSGSGAKGGEGAIKVLKDGTLKVDTTLRLSSEQAKGTSSVVKFWWSKVSTDGRTYTKIDDSETTFTVAGGASNIEYNMNTFTLDVFSGDRIALRSSADKADGAFLRSSTPKLPMVYTMVTFDELEDVDMKVAELISSQIKLTSGGKAVDDPKKYSLSIDVDSGQIKVTKI